MVAPEEVKVLAGLGGAGRVRLFGVLAPLVLLCAQQTAYFQVVGEPVRVEVDPEPSVGPVKLPTVKPRYLLLDLEDDGG